MNDDGIDRDSQSDLCAEFEQTFRRVIAGA